MKIGNHDTSERVFVMAEIGNNHEGNADLAHRMVREAAAAGADAVKFQTIVPNRLVSGDQKDRIAQLTRFQLSREVHASLAAQARDAGVQFLSTPFDLDAVDWLAPLVPAYKIASGDNNFWPLMERVARTGKPVIVSLGLGGVNHAARIVEFFTAAWAKSTPAGAELALLHCVSAYPTPEEQAGLANLARIARLPVTVGYSDHTLGIKAAELAVAAGARIIEKHFTLDKNQSSFRDHSLSVNPAELAEMIAAIRRAEKILGPVAGGGDLADAANVVPARRSIAAARELPAGHVIALGDLAWLRPGSGFPPGSESAVVGRRVARAIAAGHLILKDDLADAGADA